MIKGLIFDLDQTLIDRKSTMGSFLAQQYERYQHLILSSPTEFIETVLIKQKNGYEDKLIAYQTACAELGEKENLPQLLLLDMQKHYGLNARLFKGTLPVLTTLSESYKTRLITNGRTNLQTSKIKSAGIYNLFDCIIISESAGVKKPDSAIFFACLDELKLSPEESVYIGDNPQNDIAPAAAIGMYSVWFENEYYDRPKQCDASITELHELLKLLPLFG